MTIQSQEWRKRAAEHRADADLEPLANAKVRLMVSAKRLDELAEQAERIAVLKLERS
jgi:hypothetical protein